MTPSKRKGSRFELDLRDYLRERGYAADRCYGAGRSDDIGDVRGLPGFAIEAKNHREFRLSEWVDETERERVNAGEPFGLLVVKRKMKPAAEAFAVMPFRQMVDLVDELQRLALWHGERESIGAGTVRRLVCALPDCGCSGLAHA